MNITAAPLNIKLPKLVGVKSICTLMESCSAIRQSSGDVMIDCSDVVHIDPLGMTVLVAALESVDGNRRISMPWLSTSITSYLARMDFFERISVDSVNIPNHQRNDQSGSLLEITLLRDSASAEEVADKLATAVVGLIVGRAPKPVDFDSGDSEFEQYYVPIRYSLSELVENALTHARREGRFGASVWIASQYYQRGIVHISVVDDGCGFLATLANHPEEIGRAHV